MARLPHQLALRSSPLARWLTLRAATHVVAQLHRDDHLAQPLLPRGVGAHQQLQLLRRPLRTPARHHLDGVRPVVARAAVSQQRQRR
eukprot:2575821-Prymnesium_polylepis.1